MPFSCFIAFLCDNFSNLTLLPSLHLSFLRFKTFLFACTQISVNCNCVSDLEEKDDSSNRDRNHSSKQIYCSERRVYGTTHRIERFCPRTYSQIYRRKKNITKQEKQRSMENYILNTSSKKRNNYFLWEMER
jgi:hypothetical protein